MARLTISEAARACNVARTTIQRAVKTGRLSLDAEHRVDTAEQIPILKCAGEDRSAQAARDGRGR